MERLYDITMQTGLLFLVIFTPLAFGAVHPWVIALMELVVLLMALAWGLTQLHGPRLRVVRTPLNLPIPLFLGLVDLQLLPLPPGLMGALSPNTHGLYQRTLGVWPDRDPFPLTPPAALVVEPPVNHPSQRHPPSARHSSAIGGVMAVVELIQKVSGTAKIHW